MHSKGSNHCFQLIRNSRLDVVSALLLKDGTRTTPLKYAEDRMKHNAITDYGRACLDIMIAEMQVYVDRQTHYRTSLPPLLSASFASWVEGRLAKDITSLCCQFILPSCWIETKE